MSEFKGSKGEWFIDYEQSGHNEYQVLFTAISSTKGNSHFCDIYGDNKTAEANALLISKAPEMLEMLKVILEGKCDIPEWKKDMAFKLIKEATEL